ncbi:MAG: SDR family oxidoreductase [Dehalococcoidales bacterium]|nr:SDR family oxidoreductase [Dehalococcoidales bacterium]
MNNNLFQLEGQTAIVTGGSRGIGKAISLGLATMGADVAICSRDITKCKDVADEIERMRRKSLAISVDVTKPSDVAAMVEKVKNSFGKIDILVNSAGIGLVTRTDKLAEADWDKVVNLDLKATFLCCQAVGREMIAAQKGSIINISSMMGQRVAYGHAAYCAAKGGVDQLTRVLAVEWSRYNIRVNSIAPGWIVTDMTDELPADVRPKLIASVPLKRFGKPEEIVGAALYYASEMSSYTTGSVLVVDGGTTIGV